jgi:ribosomal protein L32
MSTIHRPSISHDIQLRSHLVYQQANENLQTAELRVAGHSCKDCSYRKQKGFIHNCILKSKQINLYNICNHHSS